MRQYIDLLRKIVVEGEDVQSGAVLASEGRKPTCRFLLGTQLRFDLRNGFPAVTTKKLLFDWVVDELLWFLRGETNTNTLGRKVRDRLEPIEGEGPEGGYVEMRIRRPIWDAWARPDGDVPHAYGEQWRAWKYCDSEYPDTNTEGERQGTIAAWDQVARIVEDLKAVRADPSNRARRRIILTAWNPPLVPVMGLPPCHTLAQFLPSNGYLDCVCHWRSIDTFTGMPFNIAQYALLTTIFAGVSRLIPRRLVCNVADCHVYDNQYEQIQEQCAREPYPSPLLVIDPRFWSVAPDLTVARLREVDPAWFSLKDYRYHSGRLKAEVAV